MEKIVIFLFAASVASVVDASNPLDELESLQNRLESYFVTEITRVEEKYNSTMSIIDENFEIIYGLQRQSVYANATDAVLEILSKTKEQISEFVKQIDSRRSSRHCYEKFNLLRSIADGYLFYVYRCDGSLSGRIHSLVSIMSTTYKSLRSTLMERRHSIADCQRSDNNTEKVTAAISCITTIANDTKAYTDGAVPPVLRAINDTIKFITNLPNYRFSCLNEGYFQKASVEQISNLKKCYQKIIDDLSLRPLST